MQVYHIRRKEKEIVDKLDKGPEDAKRRFMNQSSLGEVTMFKMRIESIGGKKRVS